jgi:hypothetical protein
MVENAWPEDVNAQGDGMAMIVVFWLVTSLQAKPKV